LSFITQATGGILPKIFGKPEKEFLEYVIAENQLKK